ncbi:esterase family protein [Rossellomorea sp. y25]|uniref:alpha/beta hydrolase n=1 Tax=Rossellomorea sp. y25 TaxID=3118174 RepID=UPI0026294C0D|nr:alpha/beta hydrolase-fold protein [uncultured Rossellomorea sp.]
MNSSIQTIENVSSVYLGNTRNVHIYLPPSYKEGSKHYPVLYMQDGQNIFHTAFNGQSWRMHEIADELIKQGEMEEIIIVGIENHPTERSNEYNFYFHGEGEVDVPFSTTPFSAKGNQYETFLIHEIKPLIDQTYRTKKTAECTALMGSSMGGAVSYHIGFRNPEVFSMVGIMSPYFYYHHKELKREISLVNKFSEKVPLKKIWMDIGAEEGPLIEVAQVEDMAAHLLRLGYEHEKEFLFQIDHSGKHTEDDWAKRVHAPLLYFFGTEKGKAVLIDVLEKKEEVGC